MIRRSFLVLTTLLLVSSTLPGQKATTKRITVEDLYLVDTPQSVTVAPNGKSAVYIRAWVGDRKSERFSLWHVGEKIENAKAMEENEPDARSPVFSPDGKWVAFL